MPSTEVPQALLALAQARAALENCSTDEVIERWIRLGQALDLQNRLPRHTAALLLLRGILDEDQAARLCGLTPRGTRRVLSELMAEHFDMSYGEAMSLPMPRRARLADDVDNAQRLRESKSDPND